MFNLLMKDLKLGVHPFFFVMPLLTGALMLVPGWIYFVVLLYFCCITIPNMFAGYKTQNDLMFTAMMPVSKKDIVKARVAVIVILELLHIVIAMFYGMITSRLYPEMVYYFFAPSLGFWGLCFVMLAIFNIYFISMYYKTAYKYGAATCISIAAALLFAGAAQWMGIQNAFVSDIFYSAGVDNTAIHASILVAGVLIFMAFTMIAYRVATIRFLRVEVQ
ncbi:MAG TPA: ABC-2 transporter permease [Paenibacillus sp.]|nr:ABC-2 transporter permease [Paenibacillus sp.]